MPPDRLDTIYPCPFSRNYGIPVQQAWMLLKVFFLYRFVVSGLFVILYFSPLFYKIMGAHNPQLYLLSSGAYLGSTLLGAPFLYRHILSYVTQAQLFIFSDILFITLIMHSCGGIGSGIGILLVITTAAGGMLVGGRCAMVFAALASCAVLAEQFYSMRLHAVSSSSLTYSGMLGASYFTIAFLAFIMAKRAEQSDRLANEHQQTIARLQELNRYIIQHLQNGLIICNDHQQILLSNEATQTLLNLNHAPQFLTEIAPPIHQALLRWMSDPSQDFVILQLPSEQEIQARFSQLPTDRDTLYMIIIEDIALYNQRLQQNKLASLGRLTASIAHEIRNPLGAISHAGQLLSEAPDLSDQDKRLTEIIQNHSLRVNNIIEDILKLSRRSPSNRERLRLDQWLPEFVDNMVATQGWDMHRFRLNMDTGEMNVLIDSGHLKQILHNLCANALKYGCKDTEIISIHLTTDSYHPCIHIIDNGPGIGPDVRQHLFEPFFTTSTEGTGLGLYISRELAELNQAKLSYDYRDGKSQFILCLQNADNAVIPL